MGVAYACRMTTTTSSDLHPLDSIVYVRVGRGRTPGQSILMPFTVIGHVPPRNPKARKGVQSEWRYVLRGSSGGVITRGPSSVYADGE